MSQQLDLRQEIVESLVTRYYDRVLRFARQITDTDAAEDVTQEVFLRLSKLEGLEDREINISYLLKIAHNLVRGNQRSVMRGIKAQDRIRSRAAEILEAKLRPLSEIDPDHQLAKLIAKLSPNERQAVHLTVCCGLSLREASEAIGVRISTVTNWKYRGLQKLAEASALVAA
ncbi:MAG: sigma-70 family RNA polymerase sigma factor [Planctomycetota bacterium]